MFQGSIPWIISSLNRRGLFPNTEIERALTEPRSLTPDDITLSQLEMIAHINKTFTEKGLYPEFQRDFILTSFLDGMDGPLARQLGKASPEGAIKDVLVDRISETILAKLIAKERNKYVDCPADLESNLQTAFQLSTLTKAACEMCGVKTKEGGIGSMLERRLILFNCLLDLGKLREITDKNSALAKKLLKKVDDNNSSLINSSNSGAKNRIDAMVQSEGSGWNNPTLDDEDSPVAIEARKYAAVVNMNKMMGLDIVDVLNQLAEGKMTFPSFESLIEKHPYIGGSLKKIKDFFTRALSIANLASN